MMYIYARKIYIRAIFKGNFSFCRQDLEGSRRKRPCCEASKSGEPWPPRHTGLVWGQLLDTERGWAVWRASPRMSCDGEPGHVVNLQRSHRGRVKRIKSDFYHFPPSDLLLMLPGPNPSQEHREGEPVDAFCLGQHLQARAT